MMATPIVAVLLLSAVGNVGAMEQQSGLVANPIRKVVTMLQSMQAKITAEAAKKEKMFDTYMCYCQNADSTLAKSIADAENKIPQLESLIGEDAAEKKQLESEVKEAKESRAQAKEDIAKATALREKEAKAYAKFKSDSEANI